MIYDSYLQAVNIPQQEENDPINPIQMAGRSTEIDEMDIVQLRQEAERLKSIAIEKRRKVMCKNERRENFLQTQTTILLEMEKRDRILQKEIEDKQMILLSLLSKTNSYRKEVPSE
jgi:hypothetical protein